MVKKFSCAYTETKRSDPLVLVGVCALALAALPSNKAFGQAVQLTCPDRLDVGDHIACGTGTLRINPDGSTNLVGCLVQEAAPDPGSCQVRVTGGLATRNVKVSFDAPTVTVQKGADQFIVNQLKMQERGQPSTAAQLTFTPLEMTSFVTIDFGGTMSFSGGQPAGNYSGDLIINADFL